MVLEHDFNHSRELHSQYRLSRLNRFYSNIALVDTFAHQDRRSGLP